MKSGMPVCQHPANPLSSFAFFGLFRFGEKRFQFFEIIVHHLFEILAILLVGFGPISQGPFGLFREMDHLSPKHGAHALHLLLEHHHGTEGIVKRAFVKIQHLLAHLFGIHHGFSPCVGVGLKFFILGGKSFQFLETIVHYLFEILTILFVGLVPLGQILFGLSRETDHLAPKHGAQALHLLLEHHHGAVGIVKGSFVKLDHLLARFFHIRHLCSPCGCVSLNFSYYKHQREPCQGKILQCKIFLAEGVNIFFYYNISKLMNF
jgi:hypothetical protein